MSAIELLTADGFSHPALVHAFTTRTGGVSEGPHESLNLTWSRGDQPERVEENRRRTARALGFQTLVFADQVHGNAVIRVDASPPDRWSAGEADALITDVPGIGLCAQTADCTPVLLLDPDRPAVAAIHAGWRGVVRGVIPAAVAAMTAAYGSAPDRLQAAIGPAVSAANYRVGPEVLEQFELLFGEMDGLALPRDAEGGAGLDVAGACRRQLLSLGVPDGCIRLLRHCTYADAARFFSSRRAAADGHPGVFGGQCGIVGLKG